LYNSLIQTAMVYMHVFWPSHCVWPIRGRAPDLLISYL